MCTVITYKYRVIVKIYCYFRLLQGFSAKAAGTPNVSVSNLSKLRKSEVPPLITIPLSIISDANSGGTCSNTPFAAEIIFLQISDTASVTSSAEAFDVSEDYPVSDQGIEAGDVVSISPSHSVSGGSVINNGNSNSQQRSDKSSQQPVSGGNLNHNLPFSANSSENTQNTNADINSDTTTNTLAASSGGNTTDATTAPKNTWATSAQNPDNALNSERENSTSSNIPYVQKSQKPYEKGLIGIISTKPGVRLSAITDGQPVALAGRVPVKVSTENGPIEVGDYLTSSSIPGIAMKALRPGQVVGKALEGFDGTVGQQCPAGSLLGENDRQNNQNSQQQSSNIEQQQTISSTSESHNLPFLANQSENQTNTNVTTTPNNTTGQEVVSSPPTNTGTTSPASSTAEKLANTTDKALNSERERVTSPLCGKILTFVNVTFADPGNFLASLSLDSDGNLIAPKIKVAKLIISGNVGLSTTNPSTLLSYELSKTAETTSKVGLDSFEVSVDVIASLKNLDKTLVELKSKQATGSAQLSPTIGTSKIPAGQSSITINTQAVSTTAKIFVTPRSKIGTQALAVESVKAKESFTVSLDHSLPLDLTFDWWIIGTQ